MVRIHAPNTLSLLILFWAHHVACCCPQVTELNVVYVKGLIFHATPHVCLKSTGNSNGLQKVTIMKHKVRRCRPSAEGAIEIDIRIISPPSLNLELPRNELMINRHLLFLHLFF